ncbi:hypothetical protein [Shinella sp. JR1-6]|uniref:hypothetical protein n=1 Tax=Shinella sp. JR1-6 TaxID=2527671 RepID=UPI00102D40B3|nr:hypothetical protein [Shinella sp. JR1-6]TAA54628.1 hypothetical protein EXZ48_26750 [Shinella sp. JR1-6]
MKEYVVAIATVIEGRHREPGEPVALDEKKAKIYGDADLVVTPEEWEKRKATPAKAAPTKAEK